MYGSLFHIYCLGYVAWGKKKGKYWKKLISLKRNEGDTLSDLEKSDEILEHFGVLI